MATLDLGQVVGKSAYEYAVDGGYAGTEAEFQALMADSATKTYVDNLVEGLESDLRKAIDKIACLVIPLTDGTEQRINLKLRLHNLSYPDYALYYEGTVPETSTLTMRLEPPPGYAFTNLQGTWFPIAQIGSGYLNTSNSRYGTVGTDGTIIYNFDSSDLGQSFRFRTGDTSALSNGALVQLEVA